jgi:hypothetical protein
MSTVVHTIQQTSRGIRSTVSDASVTTCGICHKTIARRRSMAGDTWEHMHNGFSVWCFLDSPYDNSKAVPGVAA